MAYHVELHEAAVVPFLARLPPPLRKAVERHLAQDLGDNGDHFCLREEYRVVGTSYVRYDVVLGELDAPRILRFYVSDEAAQFGVLRVLMVEEIT